MEIAPAPFTQQICQVGGWADADSFGRTPEEIAKRVSLRFDSLVSPIHGEETSLISEAKMEKKLRNVTENLPDFAFCLH